VNIKLTPEQIKIVNDELRTGHFHTAEEVISGALQALRTKDPTATVTRPNGDQREAVHEMLAFVEANRTRLEGISVKQLLHEGHRR
jgi:hypothetical protein